MSEGFRVRQEWDRVDATVIKRASALPVANVSDCMGRMFAGGASLRPMHRDGLLAGPALTVRCRPGDNLMLHKAVDMAKPGDVIVCDAGGDTTNALIGELIIAHARKRGVAGFVLNGAIRDYQAIRSDDYPVFAVGITHRGPYKNGPGEIGFAIAIDGMTLEAGDLIMGDGDGVLALPRLQAQAILDRAEKKKQAEDVQMASTLEGTLDRGWVDRTLSGNGCVFV
ncbi:RraA family protein [Pelagibacterium flavum]|uniref:Putative 4-hydroxy-4-methyl-2-oxoglutarate aldolase n=1 Tax=Pelagibacterium flavum TaxID=2984530 RepID=A0ABY6IVT7_9HYPH|nr:RraA family protein [Pelagibacterium sp. YIM 151497]UYQ73539.1 RraA family protein [Pelagibacterium sp. YIM 151497]